jgi:hypothetical protein
MTFYSRYGVYGLGVVSIAAARLDCRNKPGNQGGNDGRAHRVRVRVHLPFGYGYRTMSKGFGRAGSLLVR